MWRIKKEMEIYFFKKYSIVSRFAIINKKKVFLFFLNIKKNTHTHDIYIRADKKNYNISVFVYLL